MWSYSGNTILSASHQIRYPSYSQKNCNLAGQDLWKIMPKSNTSVDNCDKNSGHIDILLEHNEVNHEVTIAPGISFEEFDCFVRKRFQLSEKPVVVYINNDTKKGITLP